MWGTWVFGVPGYLGYLGIWGTWVFGVPGYLGYLGIWGTWLPEPIGFQAPLCNLQSAVLSPDGPKTTYATEH